MALQKCQFSNRTDLIASHCTSNGATVINVNNKLDEENKCQLITSMVLLIVQFIQIIARVVCPEFGHPVQSSEIYLLSLNLDICKGKLYPKNCEQTVLKLFLAFEWWFFLRLPLHIWIYLCIVHTIFFIDVFQFSIYLIQRKQ